MTSREQQQMKNGHVQRRITMGEQKQEQEQQHVNGNRNNNMQVRAKQRHASESLNICT